MFIRAPRWQERLKIRELILLLFHQESFQKEVSVLLGVGPELQEAVIKRGASTEESLGRVEYPPLHRRWSWAAKWCVMNSPVSRVSIWFSIQTRALLRIKSIIIHNHIGITDINLVNPKPVGRMNLLSIRIPKQINVIMFLGTQRISGLVGH